MFIVSLTESCVAPCEHGLPKTQKKSVSGDIGSVLPFVSVLDFDVGNQTPKSCS